MALKTAAIRALVATVCPLDCPDACSLDVTVQDGKVTVIDGSNANPITGGYICAKVRRFPERMYGPDRLLHPAVRKGPKGSGWFERVSWDDALDAHRRAAARGARRVRRRGDPALLVRRLERAADAGHERRRALPPARRLAARAHRLRRRHRRRQPGAVRQDAVGRVSGLPRRAAHHPVGRQPVGLGHPPRALPARGAEARRAARRRRSAHDAAGQAGRPASGGAAGHRPAGGARRSTAICSRTGAPTRRSSPRTRATPTGCASARRSGRSRARRPRPASPAADLERAGAAGMRTTSPALDPLRLGPGTQSQRRLVVDGDPGAAGRRRQVRRPRRRLRDEQLATRGASSAPGSATRSRRRGSST